MWIVRVGMIGVSACRKCGGGRGDSGEMCG